MRSKALVRGYIAKDALAFLMLGLLPVCSAQQKPATRSPTINVLPTIPTDPSAEVISENYLGMLVCPDCSETKAEITLYWEGHDGHTPIAYHMTETDVGVDGREPRESAGFFTEKSVPDSAKPTGGPPEASLIQLLTGTATHVNFLRVPGNNGELLLLNKNLHVLPENVPHSLGRVTGEQQHGLKLLTDRDDGTTITMKGKEVFLVVLPVHSDGYLWRSDRPAEMVLLEPESEHDPALALNPTAGPAPWPGAIAPKAIVNSEMARATANYHQQHMTTASPSYQAWQMVAPPAETTLVERRITFQLRRPQDKDLLPAKTITLILQVP